MSPEAPHAPASPAEADVAVVRDLLVGVADPERAPAMAAYLKGVAPFLGVPAPARRAATRTWVRDFDPGPGAEALLATAAALTRAPERELAYTAVDIVARHARTLPPDSLLALRGLALERPWWDTVDAWSAVIGRAALTRAGWDAQIGSWATDPRLWVRRISLVFQVGRRDRTDLPLLFGACLANAAERDFFLRKGIGWGLRDAARTHPEAVGAFVEAHRAELSTLSVREATKHLPGDGTHGRA